MRWPALVLLTGLTACTVGPNYSTPKMQMPSNYSALPKNTGDAPLSMPIAQSVDLSTWWENFHDGELESLIRRALSANLDLLTAASRVQEAREEEIVVGAAGLPQVNASGNAVRLHSASNLLQKIGGSSGSSGPGASRGGTDLKLYSLGFDATWEADIFGSVRRSVESAKAGTQAARWQMRDGEVSLTAEIAIDYFTLRSDQARLAILAAQEKSQTETLDLVTARARAGFVTELDVNQQRQLLAATQARRPALTAETVAMRHALAVLLGEQPGALDAELAQAAPLPVIPPSLPVGLPSDLLRARPDIRAAERRLAQATANIGVAVAALYPKFDLIASLAFSGPRLSDLLSGNNLGEAGLGSIMFPIFHGGQIHANIGAKQEEEKQAYLAYQKAILSAVQDAEDALTRYDSEQQRFKVLNSAVQTATASTALALQQYRTGLVTYASVLQTQAARLTAEDDLAQSRAALIADLVSLYKALGGGWREGDEPAEAQQADRTLRQ